MLIILQFLTLVSEARYFESVVESLKFRSLSIILKFLKFYFLSDYKVFTGLAQLNTSKNKK